MATEKNNVERILDIPSITFEMIFNQTGDNSNIVYGNFDDIPAGTGTDFPHRHDFYGIMYITGGKGTHFIDTSGYPLMAGSIYFISPGQVHYWETTLPLAGEMVAFTEDFLLQASSGLMVFQEFSYFHSLGELPALHLSSKERKVGKLLIHRIATEYQEVKFRSDSVLRAYLHILLIEIQRIYNSNEYKQYASGQIRNTNKLVRHFKQIVAQQFIRERSTQFYADQLGVTLSHLINTVKQVTGQTPGQLIRQEVVLESKRLLTHTDLTSAEVGYKLSFDDPSYFSRFFKRETAMSTMQFRKSVAKNYRSS